MDHCGIIEIESDAFSGLSKLKHLSLGHNSISSIGDSTFIPLAEVLERLDIGFNEFSLEGKYPSSAIVGLQTLRELTIDAFENFEFGAEFTALRHLTSLTITKENEISFEMHNNSFAGLRSSPVSRLEIDCRLHGIALDTFSPFVCLKHLRIQTFQYMNLRQLFISLHGLRGHKMDYLGFTENEFPDPGTLVINSSDVEYASTICVEELELRQTNLNGFEPSAIKRLGYKTLPCIRRFIISSNYFSSNTLLQRFLPLLRRLEYIDMSRNVMFAKGRNYGSKIRRKRHSSFKIYIYLPKSLKEIKYTENAVFQHHAFNIQIMTADNDNADNDNADNDNADISIMKLNASDPLNPTFATNYSFPIKGLNRLNNLDISGYNLEFPSLHFFDEFEGLTHITLSHTNLGARTNLNMTRFFQGPTSLKAITVFLVITWICINVIIWINTRTLWKN